VNASQLLIDERLGRKDQELLLTSTSAKIHANIHSFALIGLSRKYHCAILVNNPTLGFN
jgi:hypothetical protein